MKYNQFTGIEDKISVIGYGSWGISGQWNHSDETASIRIIEKALDSGINLFDTAPVYGLGKAEEILGKALKGKRDKAFIASKAGLRFNGKRRIRNILSRSSLFEEIDQSLRRLKTDYIDLWQIHWPCDDYPLEETLQAMSEIRKKGKVRYLGVCNFSRKRLEEAMSLTSIVSWQGLYNILEPNADHYHSNALEYRCASEIIPFIREKGMLFLPYSPLMQGLLSGKWTAEKLPFDENDVRYSNPEFKGKSLLHNLEKVDKLRPLEEKYQMKMPQISLNWLLGQSVLMSIIAGARTEEQLMSNIAAAEFDHPEILYNEITSKLNDF